MEDGKHVVAEVTRGDSEAAPARPKVPFFVVREGNTLARRFGDFDSAYRYALNRFGSEDFRVWREGW